MAVRVMGIVNVTPDSFSDGGAFLEPGAAIAHGHELVAEGAEILDVGGESTRPGAAPGHRARRSCGACVPVIEGLADTGAQLSIDTMKRSVARAAIERGADARQRRHRACATTPRWPASSPTAAASCA